MSIDYTNENSIFLTIGRMNPPTPGHLNVIQKLIESANSRGVTEVYVILTNTHNKPGNPISCEEKKMVLGGVDDTIDTMIYNLKLIMQNDAQDPALRQLIEQTKVHVRCFPGTFDAISTLINEKIKLRRA